MRYFLLLMACCLTGPFHLQAAESLAEYTKRNWNEFKQDLKDTLEHAPLKGMITDSVELDGVTLTNFQMEDGHKIILAKPGGTVTGSVDYALRADDFKALRPFQVVVGLYKDQPQDTVIRSFGIFDQKGQADFILKAPDTPGIYQVRFSLGKGLTFDQAKQTWISGEAPESYTTMGVVIVKS